MLRLIDPTDPDAGVAIDENALRDLAGYVLARRYGNDWNSKERHEDHSFHDDPSMNPECAHCAIHRSFNGNGHAVAVAQVAFTILSAGGPRKHAEQTRLRTTD